MAKKVFNAAKDGNGVSRCTTCGIKIGGKVKQGKRMFRDWDIDHIYKVRKLKKRTWGTRKAFLDAYNHLSNLRARCQRCNRTDQ